jgi:hypothetical protein
MDSGITRTRKAVKKLILLTCGMYASPMGTPLSANYLSETGGLQAWVQNRTVRLGR